MWPAHARWVLGGLKIAALPLSFSVQLLYVLFFCDQTSCCVTRHPMLAMHQARCLKQQCPGAILSCLASVTSVTTC